MNEIGNILQTVLGKSTVQFWLVGLLFSLAIISGVAWPTDLQAETGLTLDLASLEVTDPMGTAIDLGTFDSAVQTYSANVASTVERVTVTARPESDAGVYVNLTPGDYGPDDHLWEVESREVRLNHGRNLIVIGVYSYQVDEPLRVYTVEINRAGSATQGAENYIRSSSLSTAREGSTVPFLLTRSGDVSAALTVPADVWSTDNTNRIYVLPHIDPVTTLKRLEVEFLAGSASAIMNHETADDSLYTGGYHLGVTLIEGTGYRVPPFNGSGRFASTLVWDNDINKPNLESLSLTDQNGASVAIGEFDPDLTSYSGSVGSEVTHVTVIQSTTERSRFSSRVLPPDNQPNVAGHQVALQHGANLIFVILRAPFHDDAVTSGTYDVIVTRAGSPSGTPTPTVSVYGLMSDAKEGYTMPFILARTGDTSQSLTVTVNVSETGGDVVPQASEGSSEVAFPAGSALTRIEVPTVADQDWEEHSTVTVAVMSGTGYELSSQSDSASSTVKDNDVPAVTAAFTVDSSQPQEGDVVTATVKVTTDGPKQPHNHAGNLEFSTELGRAQQEDLYIPFGSNYRNFPASHRITGTHAYSLNDDGSLGNSASFSVNQHDMQPVESGGVITHYQYQFSVPIFIVDDERAEADETFDISVQWDSYSRRTVTMDQGITSRTVTIQEHDDTPATPSPISYITVVIADSGTAGSTYTVSWYDTGQCVGSQKYEVYLTSSPTALSGAKPYSSVSQLDRLYGLIQRFGTTSIRATGGTWPSKLGETANTNTQLTVSKDDFPLSGQRNVGVYCVDIMWRSVGVVPLPSATENSVERPVSGTYSSQPALTSLTVSPGTLGPGFSNYGFLYSVLDVPDSSSHITLNATARSGYTISWDPSEDADANADGHQVDLAEGYNSVFVSVDHDLGINSFTYELIVKRLRATEHLNSPATGSPTISGTVQVGETLTASTSGISDDDGLTNPSYTYQWIANDGTADSDIAEATASSYTLVAGDAGKTIKVKVTFTDDGGNEETLTSPATTAVAPTVPGAPGSLNVSVNHTGRLNLSWDAPESNGGSAVTGYKVQWKEATDSWDTPADVSETTVTGTSHTVSGLTDGVEYTFRVLAVNSVEDSTASTEESGTPKETTAPTVSSASVDWATLTITFSEGLSESPVPATTTLTVTVDQNDRGVDSIAISGSTVTLTLASAVTAGNQVTVSYTVPSDAAAVRLKDLSDNAAESFTNQAVTNNTVAAQTPLTATIHDEPASHDGQTEFTFELRFSEDVTGLSYKTLRDHAFTVTGGDVKGARRLEPPQNIRWEIKIRPTSSGAVTIVLPITGDCTAAGAVCTTDGRKLSNHLELIVSEASSQQSSQPQQENSPATGSPTISGTVQVGETLTASTSGISDDDGLTNPSYTYQWIANDGTADSDIAEATASSYTLVAGDAGKTIKVKVTLTDDGGNEETLTSAATTAVKQALTASVHSTPASHDGSAAFTFELRFSEEPEEDFSYVTLRDHAFVVTGGTVANVRRLEPGKNVRWEITVQPSGDADVTLSLPVTTDCASQGAICTGDGRMLSAEVEVTVSGPGSQQSSQENSAATGAPTISGTAQVGDSLTADTSGIADADGLTSATFGYRWLADDAEISGATGSSYTLTSSEQGKTIKVRVTFTDDAGNAESLTSDATAAVAARPNSAATGAPTISGTAQVGETLTAATSGIRDDDGIAKAVFAYQWVAGESDINGATGSSYTLTSSEQGKAIKVRVTFTDDAGNAESLTSAATATVAAAPSPPSPLTASVHNTPTSHDGQSAFTFELRFSETPKDDFSYRTLRDHAFTMTGGEVVNARRLEQGKNIRWEITVTPDGNAGVTIILPVTTDCAAEGAICTGDGRMLSTRLELAVSGPGG